MFENYTIYNLYANVVDETTKLCDIGDGTNEKFYQSLGMVKQDVEQAYDGSWYLAGFAPEKPQAEINAERIYELKGLLTSTDYKAIKFAEGLLTEEEYATTRAERQAFRDEINQLEGV